MNRSDGRKVEIRRSREAWDERREEIGEQADFHCEDCGAPAPLHDQYIEREEGQMPIRIPARPAAHIRNRKAGSGSRDDSKENLRWLCHICHRLEHAIGKGAK